MRRCFIHIGAHKTGTTAVQQLLSRNGSALQKNGYFYPQAGRLETGPPDHYNLAWEISGDRRFQVRYGTINDLLREVQHRSEDIILSSEDFECSLYSTQKFSGFISLLQSCGFLITVILYVRNQIDYLPRIYLTLLHFGLNLSFDHVLAPALDKGEFRWREWIFNFDYCDLLRRVNQNSNVSVIVRSYDQAGRSICQDFLSIFKLTLVDLDLDDEVFANMSLPLRDYVLMFLRNRMGRQLLEGEDEGVNSLILPEARKIELSPRVRADLFQKFRVSNRSLFIQHGIPEPKLETGDEVQHCHSVYIDQLFSENLEACLVECPTENQQS